MVRDPPQAPKTCFKRPFCLNGRLPPSPLEALSAACTTIYSLGCLGTRGGQGHLLLHRWRASWAPAKTVCFCPLSIHGAKKWKMPQVAF